jgi:hypothetical protein
MSCILDREKDLVQEKQERRKQKWLVYWFHLVLMCDSNLICDSKLLKKNYEWKRVADYDFAIATLKKKVTRKIDCIGKKDIC